MHDLSASAPVVHYKHWSGFCAVMNVSGPDSGVCGSEAEHRLFSVIFSSYNQYIRPVENVSDPVIVQFEVSMSQLVKVVSEQIQVGLLVLPWCCSLFS